MDVLTPAQRHLNMSRIRGKDTQPELVVRSHIHGFGYRFTLHRSDLPGKPDIVLPSRKKIIFVHGCYWHMHNCRYGRVQPKTNARFWHEKRTATVRRDRLARERLRRAGWSVFTVWECWTRVPETLDGRLLGFLRD